MYVVLAWFSDRSRSAEAIAGARSRFDDATSCLVPDTYIRRDAGGDDWGLVVLHASDDGAYRWRVFDHKLEVYRSLGLQRW